jgi:cytochrome P450 family 619
MLPLLHYIPERLLGNWKTRAKHVGSEMNKLYSDMLQLIRKRREEKGKMSTFMDRILDQEDKLDFDDHQLYFLGGTMMEGVRNLARSVSSSCADIRRHRIRLLRSSLLAF